jgi:hypothetical protein
MTRLRSPDRAIKKSEIKTPKSKESFSTSPNKVKMQKIDDSSSSSVDAHALKMKRE